MLVREVCNVLPPHAVLGLWSPGNDESITYLMEILQQQGLFIHVLESLDQLQQQKHQWPRITIISGARRIIPKERKLLEQYVKQGDALILLGPVEGLEDLAGAEMRLANPYPFPVGGDGGASLGEGFLSNCHPDLEQSFLGEWLPLHGFGCAPVVNDSAEVLAEYQIPVATDEAPEGKWPAIIRKLNDQGIVLWFAPDLVGTVRHIQEGRYIDQDGIPAADGSAPINDGTLKCEDGIVLDWTRDRRPLSHSQPVPAFTVPVADAWRAIFSQCVELAADHCKVELQRVDFWPNGTPFVALISHDTDGNNERLGRAMLDEVNTLGIHTTWCLIPPGYSSTLCNAIRNAGNELAFHFDAQSFPVEGVFSLEVMREQLEETKAHTGIPAFYSNKNHYTRWEGRVEFFRWCAAVGIKVDQSKGPSKAGTLGFPFGTCHPWRAVDDRTGQIIDCLEMGFQSQDLGLAGAPDIGLDLLEAVKLARGVAHVIFHPAHYGEGPVTMLMQEFVANVKKMGGLFMTSQQIGEWWNARQKLVESLGKEKLPGAVILQRIPARNLWNTIS